MRFALLALPFALIGAAAAAAARSENNLVESSLQGRQSCLARGEPCRLIGHIDICCPGLQCQAPAQRQIFEKAVGTRPLECRQGVRRTRMRLGEIKPRKISVMPLNWRELYSSRNGEELPLKPSVRFPGSVWKQIIGLRLKYQK
ncbi:hypothetical protein DFH08DRAFT_825371 [Mycena albidolilacea]|uniref:Uncharacterized protein n=1 Tax=Mycena albidolilacea TaxID=1033008 RepID=A0AAD6Z2J0_9AGAR|nr:hypothetical protein DFH08DRAFT_825371 [Mycena albidolilacea]